MKRKWQELRVAVLFFAVIGLWGFLYPELETTANTYAIVLEDGTIIESSEMMFCEMDGYFYLDLQQVDRSKIKVSSKLMKLLQEFWEEDRSRQ